MKTYADRRELIEYGDLETRSQPRALRIEAISVRPEENPAYSGPIVALAWLIFWPLIIL